MEQAFRPDSICIPGPDGHCAICGDDAFEGEVVALLPAQMAVVESAGGRQEVAVDLIEAPQPGDVLLIHLGFAIARLEGKG